MSARAVPWRAIWPVTDPTVPLDVLFAGARADLPAVARRHGLEVVRADEPRIVPGRLVPGCGGAAHVVTITAHVARIRDLKGAA